MRSFVKDIVLNNISFQVHFNEYYSPNGKRYFVFAGNRHGDSYSFNMERKENEWRIVDAPRVHECFLNNEKKLSDLINES
jgi:hypothetical protein